MSKLDRESLDAIREQLPDKEAYISVGMSACGIAAGAEEVFKALVDEVEKRKIPVNIRMCGCVGMCYAEPLVEVKIEGLPTVTYGRVTKEIALRILESHVAARTLLDDCIYGIRT